MYLLTAGYPLMFIEIVSLFCDLELVKHELDCGGKVDIADLEDKEVSDEVVDVDLSGVKKYFTDRAWAYFTDRAWAGVQQKCKHAMGQY